MYGGSAPRHAEMRRHRSQRRGCFNILEQVEQRMDNEDVPADWTPAPRGLNFSYVTADACARQSRASVSPSGGARDRIQVSFPIVLSTKHGEDQFLTGASDSPFGR